MRISDGSSDVCSSDLLFACTQNSVRSPMAESLLKHLLGHRIYVDSVGVRGRELDPFVIEVMDEIGIDLSRHRPKSFDNLEDTYFDLIISLSPEAQHQAVELTRTKIGRALGRERVCQYGQISVVAGHLKKKQS